jgi:hypothetical protein
MPADVAIGIEEFALAEIANRSDHDGPLARSSATLIHRTEFLFCSLAIS